MKIFRLFAQFAHIDLLISFYRRQFYAAFHVFKNVSIDLSLYQAHFVRSGTTIEVPFGDISSSWPLYVCMILDIPIAINLSKLRFSLSFSLIDSVNLCLAKDKQNDGSVLVMNTSLATLR